jgi:hypothetical protein
MHDERTLIVSFKEYTHEVYANFNPKKWRDPDDLNGLPEHHNNLRHTYEWRNNKIWKSMTSDFRYFTQRLYNVETHPLFGGKKQTPETLW